MNIIAWVLLGLVAGAITKLLYPGRQDGSIINTIILGIAGALLGGSLYSLLTGGTIAMSVFNLPSLVVAILGAMIALFLWGLVTRSA